VVERRGAKQETGAIALVWDTPGRHEPIDAALGAPQVPGRTVYGEPGLSSGDLVIHDAGSTLGDSLNQFGEEGDGELVTRH
jgi:hypothetical protein